MLTKKHFRALASFIYESQGDYNVLVNKIVIMCKNDNPNFDRRNLERLV